MISVEQIQRLDDWIASATEEGEREGRAAKVRVVLFDGRSEEDVAEIERVIEDARRRKAVDELTAPPAAATPPAAAQKRVRLYSPRGRFTRSTVEEGVRAELDAMDAEARGTPLYDLPAPAAKAPAASRDAVAERLRRLVARR